MKEGEGGLRDLHSLQWLAYVLLGSGDLKALEASGALTGPQLHAIEAALDFLLNIRTALHNAEGRKVDVLGLGMLTAVGKGLALVGEGKATKRRSDGATKG